MVKSVKTSVLEFSVGYFYPVRAEMWLVTWLYLL